jgi:hypothetical protein
MKVKFEGEMSFADLQTREACVIIEAGTYEMQTIKNPYGGSGEWLVLKDCPTYGLPASGLRARSQANQGVKFI